MEMFLAGLAAHTGPLLCVLLAAFLQSLTGFGLALVTAPLLMLFYDPKVVVTVVLLLCLTGNLVQGFVNRKRARLRLVAWLFVGVLAGLPFGMLIFTACSSDGLKLLINGMVLFALTVMQLFRVRMQESKRNAILTGLASGITSATTGMAGPPFLLFIAHTRMKPQVLRATCFVFFLSCNFTALVAHMLGGQPMAAMIGEYVYLLPGLVLGILLGNLLYPFMPKEWIRRFIYVLLYTTSIFGIGEVVYQWFL